MTAPTADRRETIRIDVLRELGVPDVVGEEILAYNANRFEHAIGGTGANAFPLDDEPFVADWLLYEAEATAIGAAAALTNTLVQLRFPIAAGISELPQYRAATREGRLPAPDGVGIALRKPDQLRVSVHATAAGRIPVIVAGDRDDFETLVCALIHRNEPVPVRPSMGAAMLAGYTNWRRIAVLRQVWLDEEPGRREEDWLRARPEVLRQKQRYQDRFILLSTNPYSDTPAVDVGLDDEAQWRELSLTIRLEHECAHYFTRRVFNSMRNSLLDELIADYVGIVAAAGRYRAAWFLRFLGFDSSGNIRPDGRIHLYRGTPPLSDRAFAVVAALVVRAAIHLERFDRRWTGAPRSVEDRARMTVALSHLTLEELACDGADDLIEERLDAPGCRVANFSACMSPTPSSNAGP